MKPATAWPRAVDAGGSIRAVEILRIAAGPMVILHLWPFLDSAAQGLIYRDRFWEPFVTWYPELGRHAYLFLLRGCVVAAVLVSIGLFTRVATGYVAGFVGYNLFLSVTHFHHNRAFLFILLMGLALLPVGRNLSVDALLRRTRTDSTPLWPLWLMRFEVIVVYGASGLSKLIDGDWWNGVVTRLRVEQWWDVAAERGVPEWVLDLASSEGFHWWFAKAAVVTELFIAVGMAIRRTRLAAVWIAIPFHLAIELTAEVQVFSWAALAALVIWVTPRHRDRRLELPARWCRTVSSLDWLGRFDIVAGDRLVLHDRGRTLEGGPALRMVLTRLPITFWPTAPFNLPGLRRWWDERFDSRTAARARRGTAYNRRQRRLS
jgi:hypothetical protein